MQSCPEICILHWQGNKLHLCKVFLYLLTCITAVNLGNAKRCALAQRTHKVTAHADDIQTYYTWLKHFMDHCQVRVLNTLVIKADKASNRVVACVSRFVKTSPCKLHNHDSCCGCNFCQHDSYYCFRKLKDLRCCPCAFVPRGNTGSGELYHIRNSTDKAHH